MDDDAAAPIDHAAPKDGADRPGAMRRIPRRSDGTVYERVALKASCGHARAARYHAAKAALGILHLSAFLKRACDLLADLALGPGESQLLAVELPETPPKRCELTAWLVRRGKRDFPLMLARIRQGGSIPSAAGLVGISRVKLARWLERGLADRAAERDTMYAKFVADIDVAAILPALDAEERLFKSKPLDWLRSGPGRWRHSEGTWQPAQSQIALLREDAPATVGTSSGEAAESDAPAVDTARLREALAVLAEQNLLNSPEFSTQLTEQHAL